MNRSLPRSTVFVFTALTFSITSNVATAQSGVVAWGDNGSGQTTVPELPTPSFVEVDAGDFHRR